MQLPAELRQAYETVLAEIPFRPLSEAADRLSQRYRQTKYSRTNNVAAYIQSDAERVAYLATRLPATYAAAHRVWSELNRLAPSLTLHSLLDLGAGSGAATWAASALFPGLKHCTLFEQDSALIELGQRLAVHSTVAGLREATWQKLDLRHATVVPPHDAIIASYALSELSEVQAVTLALRAWEAAGQTLVILEPGTTHGFGLLRKLRDELIAQDANLLAPCPHSQSCPLESNDWCHFAARVERTSLQRRLKAAELNYEDEKFSYLIFTRASYQQPGSRVLRHPQRQAGATKLQLCTRQGLQTVSITKRDKETWRRARKTDWGDEW